MSYNLSTKEGLLAQTLHVELDIHLYLSAKHFVVQKHLFDLGSVQLIIDSAL